MEHSTPIFFFHSAPLLLLLLLLLPLYLLLSGGHAQLLPIVDNHENDMETYIIDVERHHQHDLLDDEDLASWHASFLPNSTLDSGAPRLLYSYRHVLNGFSARLTRTEMENVKSKPGFLYAQSDHRYNIETTYTPRYLGLTTNNGWGSTMMGQGIIMGIIDTGVKPNHPSFDDQNMPPPPQTHWKGNCSYKGFACNKKIIGAKGFFGGTHPSPLDTEGHGTHVASIAAGSFVRNANVLGMARGTASGMAPMAHLSIYKVCFSKFGCERSNIYAGIDQAIKDGVHIISMSISGEHNATLYEDTISRGSMAAIQHNIFAVASAGNAGPNPMTLSHSAPWVLAAGAAATDRRVVSIVELGDGTILIGESAYQPRTWNSSKQLVLEYPGLAGNVKLRCCVPSEMANLNLRGKMVMCEAGLVDNVEKGRGAYKVGAEGMILINQPIQGYTNTLSAHVLPAANVNYPARVQIFQYFFKYKPNATAAIRFNSTRFGFTPSPTVGSFSSRGPSRMNGGLIKPDLIAPGVNILAAWPTDVGPNPNPLATHTFNFLSGTSMAAPHVSGTAALIRSKHRGWTPSEILSAIVTTANDSWTAGPRGDLIVDDKSNDIAGIYTMGAGMLSPIKAIDPGLVFGLTLDDYHGYLCGLGYNDREVRITMGNTWIKNCSSAKKLSATELNYPSVAVNLTRSATSQKVSRTAKNVGDPREEYTAKITEPAGVTIYLSTYKLKFTRVDQEISYEMTFDMITGGYPSQGSPLVTRGKIAWDSGKHLVTTPIAIRFV